MGGGVGGWTRPTIQNKQMQNKPNTHSFASQPLCGTQCIIYVRVSQSIQKAKLSTYHYTGVSGI